jgi:uncharacterized protein (DUF2252 family)
VASELKPESPPLEGSRPRAWPHVDEGVGNRQAQVRRGKDIRSTTPRASHAEWRPPIGRTDPVTILMDQAVPRVPELVPLRNARMLTSPFAFFRGSAAIMAADLAHTPRTGIKVQLCGDAHLSNFGGYASPDRQMVFDLNDFDETLPGPWEWDVKRLFASLAIACRERGFSDRDRAEVVRAGAAAYRNVMRHFATVGNLTVWYSRMTAADIHAGWGGELDKKTVRTFDRNVEKAMTKDSAKASAKLTRREGGAIRIAADPPLVVPIADLLGPHDAHDFEEMVERTLRSYRASLSAGRRHLIERYRYVDAARKVVGVGSVGTRAWVVLMLGIVDDEPLMLQLKEASTSVLAAHAGRSVHENQGQRVVAGQQLLQAASDIFLGWTRITGVDGVARDFYIRQLWDWKLSIDVAKQTPATMRIYAQVCGWILARAHARSGDRVAIAAYLGQKDTFDVAMTEFAEAYADQNERDYNRFVSGAREQRFEVAREV